MTLFYRLSCGLLFLILSGCQSLFYYPTAEMYYEPQKIGLNPKDVWIDYKDKEAIHAWLFTSPRPALGSIVFFHGNAENMTSHYMNLAWIPDRDYNFIIFDYPGYGKSPGSPSPESCVESSKAVVRWMHKNFDSRPLLIYGQSLGGAVAQRVIVDIKDEIPIKAVVLDSTFPSYQGIARRKLSSSFLTWLFQPLAYVLVSDRWAIKDISKISPIPTLVIHGQKDTVVEPEFGDQIFAALKEPKQMWKIEEGHHSDVFWTQEGAYRDKFVAWLKAL